MHKTYKPQKSNPPLSPVSPLESNGENWKYPPIAYPHLKGQGTSSKTPLEEIRSKKRLSHPFEQPYPISTSGQRQVSARPEYWKSPPIPNPHLKGQGASPKGPLEEVRSKRRLSRPFEQPYPITTSGQSQIPARPKDWKSPPIADPPHLKRQETSPKAPLEEIRRKRRLSRPFEQPYF